MRPLARIACALGLLLAAACLEFEEQEIRFAYDAERDLLHVQLIYRGLGYGDGFALSGTAPPAVEETEAQLDRIAAGKRLVAFVASWPFGSDLDLLDQELEEERDDPVAPILRRLLARVAIDQGDFFRGPDGRLCGWQHLRVSEWSSFLADADAAIAAALAEPTESAELCEKLGLRDPESRELVARGVAAGRSWLERRGSALVVEIPASRRDARALIERTTGALRQARAAKQARSSGESAATAVERVPEPDRERDELLAAFEAIDFDAREVDGGVELILGDPSRAVQLVHFRAPPGNTPPHDLAPLLERREVEIRDDLTDEKLRQDFARFRRD